MRIAIIGCGNMGGAIARGLSADKDFLAQNKIAVSNRSQSKLDILKSEYPQIEVSTDNKAVAKGADIVIIAVKPWLVDSVLAEMKQALTENQIYVSVAAGITFSHLQELLPFGMTASPMFRAIPNTAVSIGESMTVIAKSNASKEQVDLVFGLFSKLGKTVEVEERLMAAASSLCSCGIAYALRYVRAAMEGGVELGLYPQVAKEIVAQTMKGAADLLLTNNLHPEEEIDKVTTPGGITIKGLNKMEECGFTRAVIEGLKASAK